MLIEGRIQDKTLAEVGAEARRAEAIGYAGLWSSEINTDPFMPLALAARETSKIELGTGVAIAFARSPMLVAYTAWELQRLSEGRFTLGLGTQVKPHITRRFGMPWSSPAARMREYVLAIRAIWATWQDGRQLDFQGEFYRHDLMPPSFVPEPVLSTPVPKIVLAAVGDRMCEVAGETADGVFVHPFSSIRYLHEFTLPAVQRGRATSATDSFAMHGSPMIASGADDGSLGQAIIGIRRQIAFYASTPSYRAVFALHGWGEVADRVHELSRSGRKEAWGEMGQLITDEILEEFAVVTPINKLAAALRKRFDGVLDRIQIYAPYDHDEDMWEPVIKEINGAHRKPGDNQGDQVRGRLGA